MRDDRVYWIWLQKAVGVGRHAGAKLLEHFGSAQAVYAADREVLSAAGFRGRLLEALCRKSLDAAKRQLAYALGMGWVITPESEAYPERLRHIAVPPLVLYGMGVLPRRDLPYIAMVGTRGCTEYGTRVGAAMAAGLAAAGCAIVSGGARGIDRAAHEGALYAGGYTVAIQACGINVNYPWETRDLRRDILESGGTVMTEFPPDMRVQRGSFHIRNRLMSGMAPALCVVEAPHSSGALITTRAALEQGRDVYVVPGRVTDKQSAGSHRLIREGAVLVTQPADILSEYPEQFGEAALAEADRGYAAYQEWLCGGRERPTHTVEVPTAPEPSGEPVACPATVTPAAARVYEVLAAQGTQQAELLCRATGLTAGELFSALTELELYDCVESLPGKQYRIRKG